MRAKLRAVIRMEPPKVPIPWDQLGVGSGWALVAFCVYLIFTGRLVPKPTYDRAVHEGNEWRTESRIKDAQIAEKDTQLRHMGEVGRTVEKVMSNLQAASQVNPPASTVGHFDGGE